MCVCKHFKMISWSLTLYHLLIFCQPHITKAQSLTCIFNKYILVRPSPSFYPKSSHFCFFISTQKYWYINLLIWAENIARWRTILYRRGSDGTSWSSGMAGEGNEACDWSSRRTRCGLGRKRGRVPQGQQKMGRKVRDVWGGRSYCFLLLYLFFFCDRWKPTCRTGDSFNRCGASSCNLK